MKDDIQPLLRAAHLPAVSRFYQQWRSNPENADKSHDELIRFLGSSCLQVTLNRRVSTFLRRAHLPKSVSMMEVWPRPGLSARKLDNLAQCGWLSGGKNLVIVGEHGVGKTFLVGALAREAVRQTSSVRWHRVAPFLDECTEAKPEDLQKTLKTLSLARLLVLDGFAEHVTLDSSAQLLKKLLDARTAAGLVTIVVSGRPVEEWDTLFQDQSVANALFHRVLDRAMVIELERA